MGQILRPATVGLMTLLVGFWAGCGGEPAPVAENPFTGSAGNGRSAPPPPSVRSGRLARTARPPAVHGGAAANGSRRHANGADGADGVDDGDVAAEAPPQFTEQDRAIAEATRQIEESPFTTHVSYNNRAVAYFQKGETEKALADLNKAIELKPDYAEAWYNRGVVHETLGRKLAAEADFAEAQRLGQ